MDHAPTEDGADAAQVLLDLRQQEETQRRLRALDGFEHTGLAQLLGREFTQPLSMPMARPGQRARIRLGFLLRATDFDSVGFYPEVQLISAQVDLVS